MKSATSGMRWRTATSSTPSQKKTRHWLWNSWPKCWKKCSSHLRELPALVQPAKRGGLRKPSDASLLAGRIRGQRRRHRQHQPFTASRLHRIISPYQHRYPTRMAAPRQMIPTDCLHAQSLPGRDRQPP